MPVTAPEYLDLIRLADPDDPGQSVSVRVLGRDGPGTLPAHDWLDCEIVVESEFVRAKFPTTLLPEDLTEWSGVLDSLPGETTVSWLDSGRTPELTIEQVDPGELEVSISDFPASGVTVRVPLTPGPGWVDEQRALLAQIHATYPSEVVESSDGIYSWRRHTPS